MDNKSPEKYNVAAKSTSASSPCSEKFGTTELGDESSEENIPVPINLIGAENYLTLTEGIPHALTKNELTEAVAQCKNLILDSAVCSDERKWLVRRLIELRYQLYNLEDAQETIVDSENAIVDTRIILGHHLKIRYQPTSTTKRYCDACSGSVWNVVQSWYQCSDCRYRCHLKCVDKVIRPCAHLAASEKPSYETRICPEVGLAAQNYKCPECQSTISFKSSWLAPRLCDYTGLYYCTSCHWNNSAVIPARACRNWDFKPYYVCRATYQLLRVMRARTLIKVEPTLFGFVKELAELKRLRERFSLMKSYLVRCREAKLEKKMLWKHFGTRSYLLEPTEVFSLQDLIELHNGTLLDHLNNVAGQFTDHITKNCLICCGQGYRCELCDDKDDVMFPFYSNVYICPKCSWVYHKACWLRLSTCFKCERKKKKSEEQAVVS